MVQLGFLEWVERQNVCEIAGGSCEISAETLGGIWLAVEVECAFGAVYVGARALKHYAAFMKVNVFGYAYVPVSYTHLTLPTIEP